MSTWMQSQMRRECLADWAAQSNRGPRQKPHDWTGGLAADLDSFRAVRDTARIDSIRSHSDVLVAIDAKTSDLLQRFNVQRFRALAVATIRLGKFRFAKFSLDSVRQYL